MRQAPSAVGNACKTNEETFFDKVSLTVFFAVCERKYFARKKNHFTLTLRRKCCVLEARISFKASKIKDNYNVWISDIT